MKLIGLLVIFVCSVSAFAKDFDISKKVYRTSNLDFKSHYGSQYFDSYLSMELPFEPVADLFKQLLVAKKTQLTNRGEAHITVITPIEYREQLQRFLSIEDINKIAKKERIQRADFSIKCLGRGSALIDKKQEYTYFLVVSSNDLLDIRREIIKKYNEKADKANAPKTTLEAQKFYPHITLGFSSRDLHLSDGVIKDSRACAYSLSEKF